MHFSSDLTVGDRMSIVTSLHSNHILFIALLVSCNEAHEFSISDWSNRLIDLVIDVVWIGFLVEQFNINKIFAYFLNRILGSQKLKNLLDVVGHSGNTFTCNSFIHIFFKHLTRICSIFLPVISLLKFLYTFKDVLSQLLILLVVNCLHVLASVYNYIRKNKSESINNLYFFFGIFQC